MSCRMCSGECSVGELVLVRVRKRERMEGRDSARMARCRGVFPL